MQKLLGRIIVAALLAVAVVGCAGDIKVAESKCAFPQGSGAPCL
jgi:hypothetical protein